MIKALGYAAKHSFSRLKPLEFDRDEPGSSDVQIDILYCGVCHSDVHQVENDWSNTVYLHGACDGVNPPATAEDVPEKFAGWFEKVELVGVGHFSQREDPERVATALVRLLEAEGAVHA